LKKIEKVGHLLIRFCRPPLKKRGRFLKGITILKCLRSLEVMFQTALETHQTKQCRKPKTKKRKRRMHTDGHWQGRNSTIEGVKEVGEQIKTMDNALKG
jgi:hypothetical protein